MKNIQKWLCTLALTTTIGANANAEDITYYKFEQIQHRNSVLLAGDDLQKLGYTMAYTKKVEDPGWAQYDMSELAWGYNTTYNEDRHQWHINRDVPYSYVKIIYDNEKGRCCHYQICFSEKKSYTRFLNGGYSAGYQFKEQERDVANSGDQFIYYNKQTHWYMMAEEYSDDTYSVDFWNGDDDLQINK